MAGRYPNGDFYDFESELSTEEKDILYNVRDWAKEKVCLLYTSPSPRD